MKREPKLRPSMSWNEIALALRAINKYIADAVVTKQVTLQVSEMSKVKDYLETFRPATGAGLNEKELLVKLMAKYGIESNAIESDTFDPESSDYPAIAMEEELPESAPVELTDDQRFDMLKLSGEHTYTKEDKMFMLNVGTMIMLKRAGMKKITDGDL